MQRRRAKKLRDFASSRAGATLQREFQGIIPNPKKTKIMHGKVFLADLCELVEFLARFAGKTTAVFEARHAKQNEPGEWVVEFKGGI